MAFLWLDTTVHAASRGRDLLLWSGHRYVSVPRLGGRGVRFLRCLDGTREEASLIRSPEGALLVPLLYRLRWLVKLVRPLDETLAGKPWLSRQLAYFAQLNRDRPDRALGELGKSSVLVVGIGGVGSQTAFALAGSGVGKLILVDPDVVEPSNLNRQFLFSRRHFGLNKAEAVAAELGQRFPGVSILTVPHALAASHVSRRVHADVVLICGGSSLPFLRPQLFEGRAVLLAGYAGARAFVGPLARPERSMDWPAVLDRFWPKRLRALPIRGKGRPNAWNTSGATINGLIGALASEVILKYLAPSLGPCPLGAEDRIVIDMGSLRLRREKLGAPRGA